jgi:hypothetical protein
MEIQRRRPDLDAGNDTRQQRERQSKTAEFQLDVWPYDAYLMSVKLGECCGLCGLFCECRECMVNANQCMQTDKRPRLSA